MSLIYGVGINDCKGWSNRETLATDDIRYRTYNLWHHILMRACSPKFKSQCPTYEDVTVCERWLRLSNFVEDLPKIKGYELWRDNPKKHICLDKDTLVAGNKEYCLEKCVFITKEESSRDVFTRHKEKMRSKEVQSKSIATRSKAVICTYPDGREEYFPSCAEAERTGKFNHSLISAVCRGIKSSHHGCKFRYADKV